MEWNIEHTSRISVTFDQLLQVRTLWMRVEFSFFSSFNYVFFFTLIPGRLHVHHFDGNIFRAYNIIVMLHVTCISQWKLNHWQIWSVLLSGRMSLGWQRPSSHYMNDEKITKKENRYTQSHTYSHMKNVDTENMNMKTANWHFWCFFYASHHFIDTTPVYSSIMFWVTQYTQYVYKICFIFPIYLIEPNEAKVAKWGSMQRRMDCRLFLLFLSINFSLCRSVGRWIDGFLKSWVSFFNVYAFHCHTFDIWFYTLYAMCVLCSMCIRAFHSDVNIQWILWVSWIEFCGDESREQRWNIK